jgi:transporter family-2 protein
VASAAAFAGRLGAAPWVALVVTGQIAASLLLDHYGLVGFARHPFNAWRGLGAILLVLGVVLVLRS